MIKISNGKHDNFDEEFKEPQEAETRGAVEMRYKPDQTKDRRTNTYLSLFLVLAIFVWIGVWLNDARNRPGRAIEVPGTWGEEIQSIKDTIKQKIKDFSNS